METVHVALESRIYMANGLVFSPVVNTFSMKIEKSAWLARLKSSHGKSQPA